MVAVVLVVLVGSIIGYVEYLGHQIHRIKVGNLVAEPPSGVENIVLVGSTSRCALKTQNKAFGLCSEGVTGVNSDVVMILHVNPNTKAASILSIPATCSSPTPGSRAPTRSTPLWSRGPSSS